MKTLVDKHKPSAILIGATNNGRDLGPKMACDLNTGLTADCTGLDYDVEAGNMVWTRPAFGGNLMAMILAQTTVHSLVQFVQVYSRNLNWLKAERVQSLVKISM